MTTPYMQAIAIGELGRDKVTAAFEYLEAWRVLTASGVPVTDLRHALDREPEPSEASSIVRGWAKGGASGLLVLRGSYGCGKTHAAVRWALHRQRAGKAISWHLASEWPGDLGEQDKLLRRLEAASALVLDDLGDGATGVGLSERQDQRRRDLLRGVITSRIASGRSTLVISNATTAELVTELGGRVMDRLRMGGGISDLDKLARIAARERGRNVAEDWTPPSRREHDRDAQFASEHEGRSPRWFAAAQLVGVVGCERGDDRLDIGRELERKASKAANDYAIELLGLEADAVDRRAAELELEQGRIVSEALAQFPGLDAQVSSLTWQGAAPVLRQIIADGHERQAREAVERRAQLDRRRREVAGAVTRRDMQPPASITAEQAHAAAELAERYELHARSTGDGWIVTHGRAEIAQALAGPFTGDMGERQAWWAAAELLRPALEAQEEQRRAAAAALESETA